VRLVSLSMQAVVLAGGQGTRLRPLTSTWPKPLLPVANVPILRRIIDKLPPTVDEVVVAGSYRLEQLADYFEEHDVGRNVTLVEEKEPLGTAGAIKNVEAHVDGPFLVFNGDVLDSLDVESLCDFHRKNGGAATIALWKVSDPRHFGVMDMRGERVLRFVEKPETREQAPSDLANAGTYLLELDVFDAIPSGKPVSIERETFPALLSAGRKIFGMRFDGYWVDCGRPETYLKANETVLHQLGLDVMKGEGTLDMGASFEGWAVLGAGCRVSGDCEIARSVLLDDVVVGNNVTITDSIVGPHARIEDDAALVDCVVAEGARVEKGVLLKSVKLDPSQKSG
jgi:mannose-1-phosphate guanylyltransferase